MAVYQRMAGGAMIWRQFSKAADNYQMFSKYKLSKLAEIEREKAWSIIESLNMGE